MTSVHDRAIRINRMNNSRPTVMNSFVLAAFVVLGFVARPCPAADSSLAIEMDVPISNFSPVTHVRSRLVGLAWLRYSQTIAQHTPFEIWLRIEGMPRSFNGRDLEDCRTQDSSSSLICDDASIAIVSLAEEILLDYTVNAWGLPRDAVRVYTDGSVDENGVTLNLMPPIDADGYDELRNYTFNRTINIDFRDPPYGQSRANLLVTDRNLPWHDLATLRYKATRNFTRIDTNDLRYRYTHNLGHVLGYGHFIEGLTIYDRTGPPPPLKSVMFADTTDVQRSSQTATRLDKEIVRSVRDHGDELTRRALRARIERRVEREAIDFILEAHPLSNTFFGEKLAK